MVAGKRFWTIFTVTSALIIILGAVVLAAAPYDSYLFNYWGVRTPAVQAYIPQQLVDGQSLGVGAFSRPQDMAISPDNKIYIVDTGNNRVIRLSEDLEFELEINQFINDGQVERFNTPSGIAFNEEGHIYIADTNNARIVILDTDANLIDIIGEPVSSSRAIIAADYIYRPMKIEVDTLNRVYVIAANVYEGIFQFDKTGTFLGFIGAPRVTPSAADIFWSRIATDAQRAKQELFLPIEYANMGLSSQGVLYAVLRDTAIDGSDHYELVKMLNPTGVDIMRRISQLPVIGDIMLTGTDFVSESTFVDVLGRDHDMFSVLDATRGRVFTYDHNGNLLYVFGGLGDMLGRFRNPVALGEIDHNLYVLDNRGITVFYPTAYADAIHQAINYYDLGLYHEAAAMWQNVLDQNPGFEIAYNWIATTALLEEDYDTALEYYRLGQDRTGYSNAFTKHRENFVERNIGWFMIGFFLVFLMIFVGPKLKLGKRFSKLIGLADNPQVLQELSASLEGIPSKEIPFKTRAEYFVRKTVDSLLYAFHVIFHPFDGFWDLKHEGRGTIGAANILIASTVVTYVFMRQYTAFTFNELNIARINLVSDATSILVPFLLWVGVNWAFTTLMEGKGTLKEIYIMSAFALAPIILLNIPSTVISHILTEPEGSLLTLVRVLSVGWMLVLLLCGTMTLHEYTMTKTVITAILIVCGIAAALFVGLLFTSVVDHVSRFIITIYAEINYRL